MYMSKYLFRDIHHQTRLTQDVMHRLRNVGSVKIVMVWVSVSAISLFDSSEEALQNCGRYFKLVNHTVSIEEIVTQVFHRCAQGSLVQGKYIERPIV